MGNLLAKQLGKPSGFLSKIASLFFKMNNDDNTKWIINQLNVQKGQSVLVIGFGTGTDIETFAELVGEQGYIQGVEKSEEMLKVASERTKSQIEKGQVKLMIGDVAEIDPDTFPKFDLIFHFNVVYFWQKPDDVLGNLARMLIPTGRIVSCVTRESKMMRWVVRNFERQTLDTGDKLIEYGEKANLTLAETNSNGVATYVIHRNDRSQ